MKEVLKKLHEQRGNDVEDGADEQELEAEEDSEITEDRLYEIMAMLNSGGSGNEDVMEKLLESERKIFMEFLKHQPENGESIVDAWVPWWVDAVRSDKESIKEKINGFRF